MCKSLVWCEREAAVVYFSWNRLPGTSAYRSDHHHGNVQGTCCLHLCFSPQRVLHRHFYCQRSWLFCLWKSMQGYLNPLLWASQLKRNTNNTKIPQFKLSERPLPFLLVLSGGPRHTGSNVCVRLMGQPSSKVRIQLVTVSRQNWQALTEESRAGALKHSHIAYYTAKIYNRGHQQELCPDVFSNSLLIRIASALQIQLNHDSDFFLSLKL